MVVIAQEASKVVLDPREYLTCGFGVAGSGKTSWCSEIDGAYFLKCEDGTKGVSVYGHNILCWSDFIDSCVAILQQKQTSFEGVRPISTIVIDVYEALWKMAGEWICANERFIDKGKLEKYDKIEDAPYGKGYSRTSDLVLSKINKLMLSGFGVVLLSHASEKTVKWAGREYDRVGPNLSPKAQDALVDACDAVGYFCIEESISRDESNNVKKVEQGRYIYWQPTFTYRAKHRLKGFPDRVSYTYGKGWREYKEVFEKVAREVIVQRQGGGE